MSGGGGYPSMSSSLRKSIMSKNSSTHDSSYGGHDSFGGHDSLNLSTSGRHSAVGRKSSLGVSGHSTFSNAPSSLLSSGNDHQRLSIVSDYSVNSVTGSYHESRVGNRSNPNRLTQVIAKRKKHRNRGGTFGVGRDSGGGPGGASNERGGSGGADPLGHSSGRGDGDAASRRQTTMYRRYRVGDAVLLLNTSRRVSNQVNRYGFPPGEGQYHEEQVGPYNYVLTTVKNVHFDEDREYYTVLRADSNEEQRGDTHYMVPFRSSRGEAAARRAAKEKYVADDDDDASLSSLGDRSLHAGKFCDFFFIICFPVVWLFYCFEESILPRLVRCVKAWLRVVRSQAQQCLNGREPYVCALRVTIVNVVVFCSTWYMFIDQARLAFFPATADYKLAVINCVVWSILAIELLFEIFIRPDDYTSLIVSEKAFAPQTVRFISFFHLFIESVCLICFISEFYCLFDSNDGSTCDNRYAFSFFGAAVKVVIGPTHADYFFGRAYICLIRLRVFGLVRHWRTMWVNSMFINMSWKSSSGLIAGGSLLTSIRAKSDIHRGSLRSVDGSTHLKGKVNKNSINASDHRKGTKESSEKQKHKEGLTKLTNASNIGTALMVTNSYRTLMMLCGIMGLFPLLRSFASVSFVTNQLADKMTQQLQMTNLLANDLSNETCDFFLQSIRAWIGGVMPGEMGQTDLTTTYNDAFLQSVVISPNRQDCLMLQAFPTFQDALSMDSLLDATENNNITNIRTDQITDSTSDNIFNNTFTESFSSSSSPALVGRVHDRSMNILRVVCNYYDIMSEDDSNTSSTTADGNNDTVASNPPTTAGSIENNNHTDLTSTEAPQLLEGIKGSQMLSNLCNLWKKTGNLTSPEQVARVTGVREGSIEVYSRSEISDMIYLNGTIAPKTFQVTAMFNLAYAVESVALSSFLLQFCVLVVVLGGLSVLRRDAEVLVLGPLRRMLKIVARYAKNPLVQPKMFSAAKPISSMANKPLRFMKDQSESTVVGSEVDDDSDFDNDVTDRRGAENDLGNLETRQLITAVSKITDLLRKCWGVAGADIISTNLASREGEFTEVFNPTVPGKRVFALFAFAAISGFDHALRNLKGDIMNLINDVANVLHGEVFRWGFSESGQCNKNLGAAFLMVFRIGLVQEVEEKLAQAADVVFSTNAEGASATGNTAKRSATSAIKKRNVTKGSTNSSTSSGRASPTKSIKSKSKKGSGHHRSGSTDGSGTINSTSSSASAFSAEGYGGNKNGSGGVNVVSLKSLPGISTFTDRAVIGMLKSYAGIHRDNKLRSWNEDFRLGMGVGAFKVNMFFGMDAGWAVEGAVGSEYKIDATYLSPHVNMASRMMSACKQYGVTILLSQAVQELMSETAHSKLRHLDTVTVKGSSVKQKIFTYDARSRGVDFFLYSRDDDQADIDADRYTPNIWNTDQDLKAMRQHITDDFLTEFARGRNAYLAGDWKTALEKLERANDIMVEVAVDDGYLIDSSVDNPTEEILAENGDGPSMMLLSFMKSKGGIVPKGWDGWHPLLSK